MTQPTANPAIPLYNFYQRYLWQASDFEAWQNGMVNYSQAMMDGTFHGAALMGLGFLSASGLVVTVDAGVAFGPTGNLLVSSAASTGSFQSSTLPCRNLVVIRPNIVQSTPITNPTDPNQQVPLYQLQEAQVLMLQGTPASAPSYPATGVSDVVLFGVRLAANATSFGNESIDLEVRDIAGKHTRFQENFGKYDSRLRPYALAPNMVGIKPSQLGPLSDGFSKPQAYSFGKSTPSIFPKSSGGLYNGSAGDTFLNFLTGAISGADGASSAFTPTIPSAGNFIMATVALSSSDTLSVSYGTQGTRTQCFAAVQSMATSGAGSLSLPQNVKLLAFVMVGSYDGVNITEIDIFDCRGMSAISSALNIRNVSASGTFLTTDSMIRANPNSGSFPWYLPALSSVPIGTQWILKNIGTSGFANTVSLTTNGSDIIDGGLYNASTPLVLNCTPVQDSVTVMAASGQWDII